MWQINMQCPSHLVEDICTQLENQGAISITLTDQYDDAILEPMPGDNPLWPHVIVHALFDNELRARSVLKLMVNQYQEFNPSLTLVEDKNWLANVQENHQPQKIGQRLLISPSWNTAKNSDLIEVILDPGMAFGTGTHPTTTLCLMWLERHDLSHQTIVDYGCGSGILAITAIKLGATHAFAIDIDEQALLATKNNAQYNEITNHSLTIGQVDIPPCSADIVIANILLNPLIELKTHFHNLLKPKGTLVVSGILIEQVESMIHAYQTHFTHTLTQTRDEWALLVFKPIPVK